MSYGTYLSAAGANSQNLRLEVLSHNLANVNTPGFKPHLAVLKARHSEAIDQGLEPFGRGGIDDIGGGVALEPNATHMAQGPISRTGRDLDFALTKPDQFFVLQRDGETVLSRAGAFQTDHRGWLINDHGDRVMGENGNPIALSPALPFQVHDDGTIVQAGARARLMVAQAPPAGDLARIGDNLFRPLGDLQPVPGGSSQVRSRSLEQSAVQPTMAMMELIEASRAYEANLKLIQHHDDATGSLINRVLQG